MSRQLTAASTLDNLKKEAKRWLTALRANDKRAYARLRRAYPQSPAEPTLRDIQHALALEHGVEGWTALTRTIADQLAARQFTDVIKPAEFESERPYGRWSSRGCDVWDAINAARGGDVPALRRLLARDPNLARYPQPIHFAARDGHTEAVQVLLDAGADPNAVGVSGEHLITIARDRGHEKSPSCSRESAGEALARRQLRPQSPITPSMQRRTRTMWVPFAGCSMPSRCSCTAAIAKEERLCIARRPLRRAT
jgi:hypothetical protein